MIDIFKYELRNDYPHMSAADRAIWERFIETHPGVYDNCQYDFHVGDAPPFNTLMDDNEDKNQDKLYRLRIDVVGHHERGVDIIEIKPKAGPSSIGQVEGYASLYKRDEDVKGNVGMVILTDQEMPNMFWLCKQKGVTLIVV